MSFLKDKIEIKIEETELETQRAFNSFPRGYKIVTLVILIAVVPAYFIAKYSAQAIYFNTYKKQAGITAKTSFTNPQPLKISDVYLTQQGTGAYSAVVLVTNPNLDLSFKNAPYKFNFYNSQKELVYSYSEKLFLLPDQSKYVIAPRFSSAVPIIYSDFQLPDGPTWQKRLSLPKVQLLALAPTIYQQASPQALIAEGSITNQSPYAIKQARITFVLFDSQNHIIGSSQREEFSLAPSERRAYKQLWPGFEPTDFDRLEVRADTNVLDPLNLSAASAPSGNAGDLGR